MHSSLDGETQAGVPYQILFEDQSVIDGTLSPDGTLRHLSNETYRQFQIWVGESGWSVNPESNEDWPAPLDDQDAGQDIQENP